MKSAKKILRVLWVVIKVVIAECGSETRGQLSLYFFVFKIALGFLVYVIDTSRKVLFVAALIF